MAAKTTNYNLVKPLDNETADIQVINGNMDIIDTKLKEVDTKASNITVPVTKVNGKTGDITLIASDIKTADGKTVESQMADLTSQGLIKKITLTNVIPTKPEEFQAGEIKLIYK